MDNIVTIKFDGCVIRKQEEVKDATIGYQVHTNKDGHIGGGADRVINNIGVDEIYSTHTEYFALLQGIKYARDILNNPEEYRLKIQGDAISVLKCVDPSSETSTGVSHLQIYANQIRKQFTYFSGDPIVEKINSSSNPAHHNAKGPLGNPQ